MNVENVTQYYQLSKKNFILRRMRERERSWLRERREMFEKENKKEMSEREAKWWIEGNG